MDIVIYFAFIVIACYKTKLKLETESHQTCMNDYYWMCMNDYYWMYDHIQYFESKV